MEKTKENKLRKLVLTVTFGLTLSIFILEIVIRIYYFAGENHIAGLKPATTTIKWSDNDIVGRRLVPNQKGWFVTPSKEYTTWLEINSQGWRDSEHKIDKSKSAYRILIIGDSFAENFQVPLEKTFFKQFEKNTNEYLKNNCPKPSEIKESQKENDKRVENFLCQFESVEIITMGLGDTGTAQQYLILKEWGLKYDPDLVIQFFFTGNDVKNNSYDLMGDPYRPYFVITNDELVQKPFQVRSSKPINKFKLTLKKNSRLLDLLAKAKNRISHTSYLTNNNKNITYPVDYHIYDLDYSNTYNKAWKVTKKLLINTKNLSNENGADYMLFSLANNEQVNNKVWNGLLEIYPAMKSANLDLEKPDKVLKKFCEKEEITCKFMLPYFWEYISQNPFVITHHPKDGHWNETGTNLVSDFLAEEITSQGR